MDPEDEAHFLGESGEPVSSRRSRTATSTSEGTEATHPVEWSPAPYERQFGRFPTRLGQGASKFVYEAICESIGSLVAWNEVPIACLSTEERERVAAEIELLKEVKHERIIEFYAAWSTPEKFVFITAIAECGDLQHFYQTHAVKLKVIKKWCRQILSGIAYLHSFVPPIIHRDIKCENVLYQGDGSVKIGDLGLCTRLRPGSACEELGTPQYMAPELYKGSYNEGVDIYAFGMCVLEMVTKRLPYSECNNFAQIFLMVTKGLLPAAFRRIKFASVQEFIMYCLSKRTDGSRPSAREVMAHPFLTDIANPDEEDEVELVIPEEISPEDEGEAERNHDDFAVGRDDSRMLRCSLEASPLQHLKASPSGVPADAPDSFRSPGDELQGATAGEGWTSAHYTEIVNDAPPFVDREQLYEQVPYRGDHTGPQINDADGNLQDFERRLTFADSASAATEYSDDEIDDTAYQLNSEYLAHDADGDNADTTQQVTDEAVSDAFALETPGFFSPTGGYTTAESHADVIERGASWASGPLDEIIHASRHADASPASSNFDHRAHSALGYSSVEYAERSSTDDHSLSNAYSASRNDGHYHATGLSDSHGFDHSHTFSSSGVNHFPSHETPARHSADDASGIPETPKLETFAPSTAPSPHELPHTSPTNVISPATVFSDTTHILLSPGLQARTSPPSVPDPSLAAEPMPAERGDGVGSRYQSRSHSPREMSATKTDASAEQQDAHLSEDQRPMQASQDIASPMFGGHGPVHASSTGLTGSESLQSLRHDAGHDTVLLTLEILHDEQLNGSFSRAQITFEFDRNTPDTSATARDVIQSLASVGDLQIDETCVPMLAAFLATMRFDTDVELVTGPISRFRWHSLVLKPERDSSAAHGHPTHRTPISAAVQASTLDHASFAAQVNLPPTPFALDPVDALADPHTMVSAQHSFDSHAAETSRSGYLGPDREPTGIEGGSSSLHLVDSAVEASVAAKQATHDTAEVTEESATPARVHISASSDMSTRTFVIHDSVTSASPLVAQSLSGEPVSSAGISPPMRQSSLCRAISQESQRSSDCDGAAVDDDSSPSSTSGRQSVESRTILADADATASPQSGNSGQRVAGSRLVQRRKSEPDPIDAMISQFLDKDGMLRLETVAREKAESNANVKGGTPNNVVNLPSVAPLGMLAPRREPSFHSSGTPAAPFSSTQMYMPFDPFAPKPTPATDIAAAQFWAPFQTVVPHGQPPMSR